MWASSPDGLRACLLREPALITCRRGEPCRALRSVTSSAGACLVVRTRRPPPRLAVSASGLGADSLALRLHQGRVCFVILGGDSYATAVHVKRRRSFRLCA